MQVMPSLENWEHVHHVKCVQVEEKRRTED